MDCHRGSRFQFANVVGFQSGNSRNENLGPIVKADLNDEEGMCDKETSVCTNLKSNYNGRPFHLELDSEPPSKRTKNDLLEGLASLDHKAATENVLYKTNLCYQFRAGSCPFVKSCDFAHSMKELRELPHNWQDIVTAHKHKQMESSEQPREVFPIPIVGFSEETRGPNPRQQFKGFSTGVGCQFGENSISVYNEHYEERESVAICLVPGTGGGCEGSGSKPNPGAGDGYRSNASWKTVICNKWESTGFCAYGRNCRFAHGLAEVGYYGGRIVSREATGSSALSANQVGVPRTASVGEPVSLVPYSYRVGAPPRRLPTAALKTGEIRIRRWKGPEKISKIYGDWIDDLE